MTAMSVTMEPPLLTTTPPSPSPPPPMTTKLMMRMGDGETEDGERYTSDCGKGKTH